MACMEGRGMASDPKKFTSSFVKPPEDDFAIDIDVEMPDMDIDVDVDMGPSRLETLKEKFGATPMGAAVLLSYNLAGLFGVAIATVGLQLTLGIQLAVDAFGPVADNAGGLAEMSELPPNVRATTDKLDAVGNTTAAIGKDFAIGSAALTSVILFSAFKEEVGIDTIEITDPKVLVGLLLGGMVPYLFSSMCMMAVGRAEVLADVGGRDVVAVVVVVPG